jgi:hypothetical protein
MSQHSPNSSESEARDETDAVKTNSATILVSVNPVDNPTSSKKLRKARAPTITTRVDSLDAQIALLTSKFDTLVELITKSNTIALENKSRSKTTKPKVDANPRRDNSSSGSDSDARHGLGTSNSTKIPAPAKGKSRNRPENVSEVADSNIGNREFTGSNTGSRAENNFMQPNFLQTFSDSMSRTPFFQQIQIAFQNKKHFNANSSDLEPFFVEFDRISQMYGVNEQTKLDVLPSFYDKYAHNLVKSFSSAVKSSYVLTKRALLSHFRPIDADDTLIKSFMSRKQYASESVTAYYLTLRDILTRAQPDLDTDSSTFEQFLRTQLKSGLLPNVRKETMRRGPTDNLQILLKYAREAEYILAECEEPQTSARYLPSNANLKSAPRTDNNSQRKNFVRPVEKRVHFAVPRSRNTSFSESAQARTFSQNLGKPNSQPNSASTYKNVQCFYCHKFGHMIAECRKRLYYNSLTESQSVSYNKNRSYSPTHNNSNNFSSRNQSTPSTSSQNFSRVNNPQNSARYNTDNNRTYSNTRTFNNSSSVNVLSSEENELREELSTLKWQVQQLLNMKKFSILKPPLLILR